HRVRAHPLRRQARGEPRVDDAACARSVAAAAHDPRADARAARSFNSRAARGSGPRGPVGPRRSTCGGDGVMATKRTVDVEWISDFMSGEGRIVKSTSGLLSNDLEITWMGRTNDDSGQTSPEELLAAAH